MKPFDAIPLIARSIRISGEGARVISWLGVSAFTYLRYWATVANTFMGLVSESGIACFIAIDAEDTRKFDNALTYMQNVLTAYTYVIGLEAIYAHYWETIENNQLLKEWFSLFEGTDKLKEIYSNPNGSPTTEINQFLEDLQFYFKLAIPTAVIAQVQAEPWRAMDEMFGDYIDKMWMMHRTEPSLFLSKIVLQYSTYMKNREPIYASKECWLLLNPWVTAMTSNLFAYIMLVMSYKRIAHGARVPVKEVEDNDKESKYLKRRKNLEEEERKFNEYLARMAANPYAEITTIEQWGRFVRVDVWDEKTGEMMTLQNDQVDIFFSASVGNYGVANSANVTVFNLGEQNVAKIRIGRRLRIVAGYEADFGVIFEGQVERVNSRWRGSDTETTIVVKGDKFGGLEDLQVEVNINKGIAGEAGLPAMRVIEGLMNVGGLPVGMIVENDYMLIPGTKYSGTPFSVIKDIINDMNANYLTKLKEEGKMHDFDSAMYNDGVWWFYVEENQGYCVPTTYAREDVIYLDGARGLLSIDYREDDNTNVISSATCLLNPHVKKDVIVQIVSKTIDWAQNRHYRVDSYTHVCNDQEFYTKIQLVKRY